jgi:hypothetical protein
VVLPLERGWRAAAMAGKNKPQPVLAACGLFRGKGIGPTPLCGGAMPTYRAPNFLDRANFHEYNFFEEEKRTDLGGWQ